MRWICWVFAVLAAGALIGTAFDIMPACHAAMPCVGCDQRSGQTYRYGAPACCVASGFNMKPGCCQCQPHCCDNVWDGYCQEKARWQAFWARVGAGATRCHNHAVVVYESAPCQDGN